jgi:hypothetical protein
MQTQINVSASLVDRRTVIWKRAILICSITLLVSSALAQEKAIPQVNSAERCRAYFTVLEADEVTVGLPMLGLNKPQLGWYKKHAEKGKLAGICYWDLNKGNKSQISFVEFLNEEKSGAIRLPEAPLYVITWGESLVAQPYSGSYQTQEESPVHVADENGNSANGTVSVPITHTYSGTKRYYVAQGLLQRWDGKTQKLVPVSPLHNHNRTVFTSASTSLLKDGLDAVNKSEGREK